MHLESVFHQSLVKKLMRTDQDQNMDFCPFKDHTGNSPAAGDLGVTMETSVPTTSRVTASEVLGSILDLGPVGITGSIV